MNVEVVQFLLPNGQQQRQITELPDEVAPLYNAMLGAGCRFEAEVLLTGQVSVTIANEEEDLDIEVIPNGPEVQTTMVQMLERKQWERP